MIQIRVGSLAVLAAGILGITASANAVATPNIAIEDRSRPADSSLLKATTGTAIAYQLVANSSELAEHLTIRDELEGRDRTFTLSLHSTINGVPFSCNEAAPPTDPWFVVQAISSHHVCSELPSSITLGKTRVVLVYWDPPSPEASSTYLYSDGNPASDAVYVVPPTQA